MYTSIYALSVAGAYGRLNFIVSFLVNRPLGSLSPWWGSRYVFPKCDHSVHKVYPGDTHKLPLDGRISWASKPFLNSQVMRNEISERRIRQNTIQNTTPLKIIEITGISSHQSDILLFSNL